MKFSCKVDDRELRVNINRTLVRVRREKRTIIKKEAEELLAESLSEVPRDTESLAKSARVEDMGDGDYAVVYGGNGTINPRTGQPVDDYMIRVHEDLEANHPNGGKAKFLEDPMRRHEQQFAERVAKRLRRTVLKGG